MDEFLEFRRVFGAAPEAEDVLTAYARLREQQADRGDELFYAARNETDPKKRRELREQLLEEGYATKWYPLVTRWLEE